MLKIEPTSVIGGFTLLFLTILLLTTEDKKPEMHKAFVAACEKIGGIAVFNAREWVCLK
jgi:hypothetical protein